MKFKFLTEGAIYRLPETPGNEPFADLRALTQVTSCSESYILECCTYNKQPQTKKSSTHRLKAHKLHLFTTVHLVFTFEEIKSWLMRGGDEISADLAESVAKNACYRTAGRLINGTRKRSRLSQQAYAAYVNTFMPSNAQGGAV